MRFTKKETPDVKARTHTAADIRFRLRHHRIDRDRLERRRGRMPGRPVQARCASDGEDQADRRHRHHARRDRPRNQPAHIEGRELRFRKLTIEPGGIVPWHSHDDRPALIFVQQGKIEEYASNCAVPIVHKAGDIRPEVTAPRTGGRTPAPRP